MPKEMIEMNGSYLSIGRTNRTDRSRPAPAKSRLAVLGHLCPFTHGKRDVTVPEYVRWRYRALRWIPVCWRF